MGALFCAKKYIQLSRSHTTPFYFLTVLHYPAVLCLFWRLAVCLLYNKTSAVWTRRQTPFQQCGQIGSAPPDIPPGWDEWMGLKGNSVYYNYTLNRNGKEEKHGDNYQNDYLPELILQAGIKFMTETKDPWFAYLSFPTAHEPFDAAPEHQNQFKDSTPTKYPTYNKTGDDIK
eukprot:sb/3472072/